VLAIDHLTQRQKGFATAIGVRLSTGCYDTIRRPQVTRSIQIAAGLFAVGRTNVALAPVALQAQLRAAAHVEPDAPVASYARAFVKEEMLMGTCYRRSVKRNSSVFTYRVQGGARRYAEARSFHVVGEGANRRFLVLARVFAVQAGVFAAHGDTVTAPELADINQAFHRVQPLGYVFRAA